MRDSGQRKLTRITAHSRVAFISVGDYTPTEIKQIFTIHFFPKYYLLPDFYSASAELSSAPVEESEEDVSFAVVFTLSMIFDRA